MNTLDIHPLSPGRYTAPRTELLEFALFQGILDPSETEGYVDDGPDIEW